MSAIGNALATQPNGGSGAPGGVSPNAAQSPMGDGMNPAAGMEAQLSQMTAAMGQIRTLGEQVKQLALENPQIADLMAQVQQMLKQAVVQMAPLAPMQTMSSAAVPGAGGPMA